jgi:hypothetical protein
MKYFLLLLSFLLLSSCKSDKRNEVLVLGTIHGSHLTQQEYSTSVLRDLIRTIDPDIILAEIPPDRFEKAITTYAETGIVNGYRVAQFPEYADVIIPLKKEMGFTIIPVDAWTQEMSDARTEKMRAIRDDPYRNDDWQIYGYAKYVADSIKVASGRKFDPYWINSPKYDEASEVALRIFNDRFNDELGAAGWDNLNRAHYAYIEKALDKYSQQDKRILITFAAGNKGWFLRELKKREDIKLIDLREALNLEAD